MQRISNRSEEYLSRLLNVVSAKALDDLKYSSSEGLGGAEEG